IVLPTAAVSFQLQSIATQRIGLAQIADDTAILEIVDDRQRLLRRFTKPIEGGSEIFAGQQKRDWLCDELSHSLLRVGAVGGVCFARIHRSAQPAMVIYDKDQSRAAR